MVRYISKDCLLLNFLLEEQNVFVLEPKTKRKSGVSLIFHLPSNTAVFFMTAKQVLRQNGLSYNNNNNILLTKYKVLQLYRHAGIKNLDFFLDFFFENE